MVGTRKLSRRSQILEDAFAVILSVRHTKFRTRDIFCCWLIWPKKIVLTGTCARLVLPRLRQKFIQDPTTGEVVLAREAEERKASWMELFYDLIFVALVSQLTHALSGGPVDLIRFSTLYLFIWRTWSSTTMYRSAPDFCAFFRICA